MYDYPRSSSPTSTTMYTIPPPSPLPKRRHPPSRRSHSPVPRIATLLPNHHSEYSPSSRAADISRLLDPAYSSQSSSSSSGSSSRAYVDHRGDLHDPDYRDFPLYTHQHTAMNGNASRIRSTTATNATTTRKQRRTSGSSARSQSATRDRRYSRPSWEHGAERADDADDDEDDEDAVSDGESQSHFSPFSSSDSRAKRAAYYSYYFGEHVPVSSSPASLHENALQLEDISPFEEEQQQNVVVERRSTCSLRRRSVESKRKETEEVPELEHDTGDDDDTCVESIPHVEGGDYVPSCTHVLRRQWQTLSLRFRFGVFHAKQRLRRSLRQ